MKLCEAQSQKNNKIESLAVVLPRYGNGLGGGAETLVKAIVDNLARSPDAPKQLEVWTTCALDHRTWRNELASGVGVVDGVTVRRFPVDERNLDIFIQHELAIAECKPLSAEEQLAWLQNSVNSTPLYEHIAAHGRDFDLILFAPYLFATSFWGSLIYPERSVLLPCLHDEGYAYLGVFKHVFNLVAGLLFNAEPERELAQRIYGLPEMYAKSAVVGMGFDDSSAATLCAMSRDEVFERFSNLGSEYIVYAGRKETGKNLDLLINCFVHFKELHPESDMSLVVFGSGTIDFLDELPEGVVDLGFLSEIEKISVIEHALVLCQPSLNESFSIVMMEAWLRETPVIVHAECDVTKYHVCESNGGLYFANIQEFCKEIEMLSSDSKLAKALGRSGKQYVVNKYSWSAVHDRFINALHTFMYASDCVKGAQNLADSSRISS